MFNNKKRPYDSKQNKVLKETNNNISESRNSNFRDLECVKEISNENVTPIHPIIFTTQGLCCNNSLIDYPLNLSADINMMVAENSKSLLEPLDYDILRVLSFNNNNLIKIEVEDFIKQTAIMNFCSVLNSSKYREYFEMIPVLEMVKEEINISVGIDRLTRVFFLDYCDKSYSSRLTSKEERARSMAFADNIAYQLGQAVCSAICLGADKAINDVVLQIHTIPNIKNLYRLLAEDNDFLATLNENSPQDYPTFVAIYLKDIMRQLVEFSIQQVIGPSISYIMRTVAYTCYFGYGDYLYFDKEAADKQIEEDLRF